MAVFGECRRNMAERTPGAVEKRRKDKRTRFQVYVQPVADPMGVMLYTARKRAREQLARRCSRTYKNTTRTVT